jgi:hypothetical protein
MATSLPPFRPASQELLNNIALARQLREAEEILYEDWVRFVRGLKSELRGLSPALHNWAGPRVDIDAESAEVNIESDATWTFDGQPGVCLYFAVFPESGYDDDRPANVGLYVNPDWKHHDALSAALETHRPAGFTSTYKDGRTDPECPFWKPLPLEDFQTKAAFDRDRFVKEIAAAFDSLAVVRTVVDGYLAEHTPPRPLVPQLKRALILDLETWQGRRDEIVEVGLILTAYDPASGELLGEISRYEGLRDPGPRATAKPSSRITAKMVKGRELHAGQIEALIDQSDVIISHNAFSFDKPRFERHPANHDPGFAHIRTCGGQVVARSPLNCRTCANVTASRTVRRIGRCRTLRPYCDSWHRKTAQSHILPNWPAPCLGMP